MQIHRAVLVTTSERTKPRSVIGSSSSGSMTAPSAAKASSHRAATSVATAVISRTDEVIGGLFGTLGAARADGGLVGVVAPTAARSGTGMSYIFAAFRPRIFFFCSVVIGAYSPRSSGIWKSTNLSISQRGVHSA